MKLISSLQLHHIFKNPSDEPISRHWPLGTSSSCSYINNTCIDSPSSSCRLGTEVTCFYSDGSSSAPLSVLKSSDVTRERRRHVTVLVFGGCERGFGSAFWEPHTVLSGATGPNLSFMCFHKEQVTACGFLSSLTISLFFWMVFNSGIHWDYCTQLKFIDYPGVHT